MLREQFRNSTEVMTQDERPQIDVFFAPQMCLRTFWPALFASGLARKLKTKHLHFEIEICKRMGGASAMHGFVDLVSKLRCAIGRPPQPRRERERERERESAPEAPRGKGWLGAGGGGRQNYHLGGPIWARMIANLRTFRLRDYSRTFLIPSKHFRIQARFLGLPPIV